MRRRKKVELAERVRVGVTLVYAGGKTAHVEN
jgi:hypothetical protein